MSALVLRPDFGKGIAYRDDRDDRDAGKAGALLLTRLARSEAIDLPVQAGAAADVIRLCLLATMPYERIVRTVSQEASLAARLLQMANTAHYAKGRPVANIAHAIMRVGERGLRSVLIAAASGRVFHVRGQPALTQRLQVRAVAVAVAVESVLRRLGNDREDAFAAGLLHDLGWILGVGIAGRFRSELPPAWATEPTAMLASVDRAHAELGEIVAQRWRFPPTLAAAMRWHHQPESATVGAPVAHAVAAGLALVDQLGVHPEFPLLAPDHSDFVRLRLGADQQFEVRRDVWTELALLGLVQERRRLPKAGQSDRRQATAT
ncbi:MAG: HDOD domain-containing protein [Myxococcales bacterium]|nr:HDOD domain-containing protein [Myxococcales bacterium]